MSGTKEPQISLDDFDEVYYPRPDQSDFDKIIERAISRRGLLKRGISVGAAAFVAGTSGFGTSKAHAASRLGFKAVAANSLDTVTVPEGYSWHIVAAWGDPLWSNGVEFDHETRGTGESQELAFGDNTDGMALFPYDGKYILAVNNEYANRNIMYGNRESQLPETADDIRKGKAAHGVSIFEIARQYGFHFQS